MTETQTGTINIFLAGEDENIVKIKEILKKNHQEVHILNPKKIDILPVLAECCTDALVADINFRLPFSGDEVLDWRFLLKMARSKQAVFFMLVNTCVQGNRVLSPCDGEFLVKPNGLRQVEYMLEKIREEKEMKTARLAV